MSESLGMSKELKIGQRVRLNDDAPPGTDDAQRRIRNAVLAAYDEYQKGRDG